MAAKKPVIKKVEDTGKHYRFVYRGVKLDPARIMAIYGVKNPLQMAILKKCLCAGDRGHNSEKEDVKDIITAATRWMEMIEEDEKYEPTIPD